MDMTNDEYKSPESSKDDDPSLIDVEEEKDEYGSDEEDEIVKNMKSTIKNNYEENSVIVNP